METFSFCESPDEKCILVGQILQSLVILKIFLFFQTILCFFLIFLFISNQGSNICMTKMLEIKDCIIQILIDQCIMDLNQNTCYFVWSLNVSFTFFCEVMNRFQRLFSFWSEQCSLHLFYRNTEDLDFHWGFTHFFCHFLGINCEF